MRNFGLLLCPALVLVVGCSDASDVSPSPESAGSAGKSAAAGAGAGGASEAGTGGTTNVAGDDAGGSAGRAASAGSAPVGSGAACLDTKSLGGDPFLCITLDEGTSESDIAQACGNFDRVEACPSEGVTYRCDDSTIYGTMIPADVVYYLESEASSDKAVQDNCSVRKGTYVKL